MSAPNFPANLPAFQKTFPDEAACVAYLEAIRWPKGFTCPQCHSTEKPYRFAERPTVFRCRQCKRDVSLTAGTVMERTHMPLLIWFWSAYLIASQSPGMSALQLQRQLGIASYETAFAMLHKLRAGLVNPDRSKIGTGYVVEVDECLLGGRTRGEGHGVHHKATVVGAVERRIGEGNRKRLVEHEAGIPVMGNLYAGRLRLQLLAGDRNWKEIGPFVRRNIAPGTTIRTDGWQGYNPLTGMGYGHDAVVLHGSPEAAEGHLPMIHIVFGNLKKWILGTHHGVSQQHLQAYLNEFVFRFNRRFYPFNAFNSVLGIAARVEGPTYDALYSGAWHHPNSSTG